MNARPSSLVIAASGIEGAAHGASSGVASAQLTDVPNQRLHRTRHDGSARLKSVDSVQDATTSAGGPVTRRALGGPTLFEVLA